MPVQTLEQALAAEAQRIVQQSGPVFSRPGKSGPIGPQGVNDGLVNLLQKGATGGSALLDTAALTAALGDAVAQGNGVQVPYSGAGPYVIDGDFTPAAPLVFAPGARLSVNAGRSVRPSEPLDGRGWMFDGAGTVTLTGRAATRVTPLMFGAKGDGVTDDLAALQRTLDAVAGVQGSAAGIGYQLPRVDLLGLTYLVSDQIEIPGGYGLAIERGRVVAGAAFPDAKYLMATGRLTDATLPSGFKIENLLLRDLYFDNRHSGGGLLIQRHNRARVLDCSFFGYHTQGLKTAVDGHEVFVMGCQFGEYVWGDASGTGYDHAELFVGTGIDFNTPDNHIETCVVQLSRIGLRLNSDANTIHGLHAWPGYVRDAGHPAGGVGASLTWINTSVYVTASANINTFNQCYIDGGQFIIEDPWRTSITNCLFLHGQGDAARSFIVLKPMAAGRSLRGLNITGNHFQVNGGGTMKGISVDTSVGTFGASITECRWSDNDWANVTPFYSHAKVRVDYAALTTLAVDLSAYFPVGSVQWVGLTPYQYTGGTALLRVTNVAGFVVTVGSFTYAAPGTPAATTASLYLEATICNAGTSVA